MAAVAAVEEVAVADGFLGRWSRRKQEVREGKPVEEPPAPAAVAPPAVAAPLPVAAAAAPAPADEAPPPPSLADAQALTPASDFTPFVDRAVSPEVRNLAMKKLFADPHFNVMDGLDIYVGDYTQPDPLPEGMLRKMVGAHALGFFDHEKKPEEAPLPDTLPGAVEAGPQAIAPAVAQPQGDIAEGSAPVVAQSQVCNAIPSDSSSEHGLVAAPCEGAAALPASHTEHDHAHLRLQPDDAPQREGVGRGTA